MHNDDISASGSGLLFILHNCNTPYTLKIGFFKHVLVLHINKSIEILNRWQTWKIRGCYFSVISPSPRLSHVFSGLRQPKSYKNECEIDTSQPTVCYTGAIRIVSSVREQQQTNYAWSFIVFKIIKAGAGECCHWCESIKNELRWLTLCYNELGKYCRTVVHSDTVTADAAHRAGHHGTV